MNYWQASRVVGGGIVASVGIGHRLGLGDATDTVYSVTGAVLESINANGGVTGKNKGTS